MGAPISGEEKRQACAVLHAQILESWGNSEGLGTITEATDVAARGDSIGRPFLGDEMLICDDNGRELPVGAVGRISGFADSRLREYRNRADLNTALIRGELVLSEDLGKMDENGYFYLCGRTNERILRKGNPVFMNDILSIVRALPGVQDAAVVGVSDSVEGEVPVSAVVLTPDSKMSAEEVCVGVNSQLPQLLRLKAVKIVSKLEKTATGKTSLEQVRLLFK